MRAIVDRRPRMALPPPPPGVDARPEDRGWNNQQRQPHDVRLLGRRERDAPIVRLLRTDRNQILLLREPADRIHEQIAVALNPEPRVRRDVRVADDHYTAFR